MSCRSRIAKINEQLTSLEQKVEYIEGRVSRDCLYLLITFPKWTLIGVNMQTLSNGWAIFSPSPRSITLTLTHPIFFPQHGLRGKGLHLTLKLQTCIWQQQSFMLRGILLLPFRVTNFILPHFCYTYNLSQSYLWQWRETDHKNTVCHWCGRFYASVVRKGHTCSLINV